MGLHLLAYKFFLETTTSCTIISFGFKSMHGNYTIYFVAIFAIILLCLCHYIAIGGAPD